MNTKLYAGNLAPTTTERDLQTLFSAHGNVAEVNLLVDRERGQPAVFAIVTMATPQGAQAAILALNGREVNARVLTVAEYIFVKREGPSTGRKGKVPRSVTTPNVSTLRRLFGIF